MNSVMIFGLKVIFVITLIIAPVSEIRAPPGPSRARTRCQDFFRTDEAFLTGENIKIGFTTVYAVSAAPQSHKHNLLT
jgi:hypothetical protein